MTWIEEVTGQKLGDIKDQIDFAEHLKDGVHLCSLINALQPGSVKKINTLKAPFKQVTCEVAGLDDYYLMFREKISRCT